MIRLRQSQRSSWLALGRVHPGCFSEVGCPVQVGCGRGAGDGGCLSHHTPWATSLPLSKPPLFLSGTRGGRGEQPKGPGPGKGLEERREEPQAWGTDWSCPELKEGIRVLRAGEDAEKSPKNPAQKRIIATDTQLTWSWWSLSRCRCYCTETATGIAVVTREALGVKYSSSQSESQGMLLPQASSRQTVSRWRSSY